MFRYLFLIFMLIPAHVHAQDNVHCTAQDRNCIIQKLIATSDTIENASWRDQSYREIAKTLAADGNYDQALALWEKIENPDTKALTIRGIGMAAAEHNLDQAAYDALFKALRDKAEMITHPPSYAIALTYIAMAQAFAGDNDGAWATAASMKNDALRHKAYGETAEIQAEAGDVVAAMKSIGFIESVAYRNKSFALVAKILSDQTLFDEALIAIEAMDNAYKKAKSYQYVLDRQTAFKRENSL